MATVGQAVRRRQEMARLLVDIQMWRDLMSYTYLDYFDLAVMELEAAQKRLNLFLREAKDDYKNNS